MKLPALLLVTAFAAGIAALGPLPAKPAVWLALAVVFILAGFDLLRRSMETLALVLALGAWIFLGALAVTLERAAVPANHVASLTASGKLDTSEPLRWRGLLRSDPLRLPWGLRYEVELEEVEVAGRAQPVSGGLRASYFLDERRPEAIPELRAGDRVEALLRARPPRNFGNPGAFDARANLARQDVHLSGSLRSIELLRKLESPPPTVAHRLARLRGRLLAQVDKLFEHAPEQAAVLRAMLLGDRSFVDHELAEAFQKTSVYHVLVISGLHVAALVAFLWWCGRRARLSLAAITLITLAILVAFVGVVEDRPPIVRAAWMAGLFLCSRLLFRETDVLNTVALSAVVILVLRPSNLLDPSFQLSFLAAGMIGALGLPWLDRTSMAYRRALSQVSDVTRDAAHSPRAAQFRLDLRALAAWLAARMPKRLASRAASLVTMPFSIGLRLWEVALISFSIQLGMLPVMAYLFHRVGSVGPLANIPAALLSGLMVPVGYLALLAGMAWSALGSVLARVAGVLTSLLVVCVEWFNTWPGTSYRIPGPPVWLLCGFFLVLALLCAAARSQRRARWQLAPGVALVAAAMVIAWHPFPPQLEAGKLEAALLDVGQGDSIFLAFPDGRTMLIDGGGPFGAARSGGFRTGLDVGEQVVSPYLWQRGLKRLDVVALTHAHQDHLEGLHAILDNFGVGELWVGRDVESPAFRALLRHATARGVPVVHRHRGDHFQWDGVTGLVLWPEAPETVAAASNNDSLVLRLDHGRVSFLLPGDIERQVEHELVERGDPLDADFLKVPHHGSRTSTTAGFVPAVTPSVAAVSVGEANPFGHPHREVLDQLRAPGVRLARTDRDGAITVTSDGLSLRVSTFSPSPAAPLAAEPSPASSTAESVQPEKPAPTKSKSRGKTRKGERTSKAMRKKTSR